MAIADTGSWLAVARRKDADQRRTVGTYRWKYRHPFENLMAPG